MHIVDEVKKRLGRLGPGDYLFPLLMSRKTHKMIQRDLEAAGLEYQAPCGAYRDWHALRHTYITRAWRTGAAPHIIKELARHSDFRLTMRYSHAFSRELQDAAYAIPNLLGNSKS
jgi:integrase